MQMGFAVAAYAEQHILIADIEPTLLPPINPDSVSPQLAPSVALPGELLSISKAFDETLIKSPRAESIRQQLGISQAAYAQALTFPNPSFLLYNGFRAEQTYQIGASIPVEAPWKVAFRLLAAKKQVKEADLEIAKSLWLLRNNVRRAYLDFVLAKETTQTISELSQLTEALQSVAQRRFDAGDVAGLDVDRARLAFSQAEIERKQALRTILQTKERLSVILGRSYKAEIDVPRLPLLKTQIEMNELLPDLNKPVPELDSLIGKSMENRLDLKIVKQSIAVNKTLLSNAYGNIIPNTQLNIGSSITGNPPNGPKIHGYFVGITQEVPMLNLQQGEIAKYRAILKQLNFEFSTKKNIVTEEVVVAYQRVMAAREQIQAYHEHVLADSAEVARLARRSYEVGQMDITSTLAAQQANVYIRREYLNAVQAYQQALTDLELAVGIPL
jgi:cobalt-zinc-cadmium efflux system outer membrane protein